MRQERPSFFDSGFFYADGAGWHIKEDAPAEVRAEFLAYMERYDKAGLLHGSKREKKVPRGKRYLGYIKYIAAALIVLWTIQILINVFLIRTLDKM